MGVHREWPSGADDGRPKGEKTKKGGLSMLPLTRYDVKIRYKGKEQIVTVYEGYNSWIFNVECLYPGAEIIDFKRGGFIR